MLPILEVCTNNLQYSGASSVAIGFLVVFATLLVVDALLTWRGLNLAMTSQKEHSTMIQEQAFN